MKHIILLAWVLLVSMQTLRCTEEGCAVVPEHTVPQKALTRFDSRLVCDDYRKAMEAQHPPVVHNPNGSGVTIRKEMTFTCRLGE